MIFYYDIKYYNEYMVKLMKRGLEYKFLIQLNNYLLGIYYMLSSKNTGIIYIF